MKKIIKILMALQIGTTSASFLTSCVKKYQYMYDIWVITSGVDWQPFLGQFLYRHLFPKSNWR